MDRPLIHDPSPGFQALKQAALSTPPHLTEEETEVQTEHTLLRSTVGLERAPSLKVMAYPVLTPLAKGEDTCESWWKEALGPSPTLSPANAVHLPGTKTPAPSRKKAAGIPGLGSTGPFSPLTNIRFLF